MLLFSPQLLYLFSFDLHEDFTIIPILTFDLNSENETKTNKDKNIKYKISRKKDFG